MNDESLKLKSALPPLQTVSEYEEWSDEGTLGLLIMLVTGGLGVVAAAIFGLHSGWALILAGLFGLIVGLYVPNPVRFFKQYGGLKVKHRQAFLWCLWIAQFVIVGALSIHFHWGE